MKTMTALSAAAVTALVLAGCGDATGPDYGDNSYDLQAIEGEWRGQTAAGTSLEIKGLNGDIRATAAAGQEIAVTWTKRGTKDDPAAVRVEVLQHERGITICAVYPDVPGRPANECGPGLEGHITTQNNDVSVDFIVILPAGVDLVARIVAGDVEAVELHSEVLAATVSGNVDIATTELAEATTVSGSIAAEIGRSEWGRNLAFTSVSGRVDVTVPATTNARVWASSTTGSVSSDFPLSLQNDGSVRGTLGIGGALLELSTVGGDVRLRRGN
jgi:hypothetical protein